VDRFPIGEKHHPQVAILGLRTSTHRRMRPSACVTSLTGERIARSIHSSRITARSGRFRRASKYRVVFTKRSYAPALLVAA
jgi:hypothetical protein